MDVSEESALLLKVRRMVTPPCGQLCFALADNGGWSALLAGTVKRNTLLRFQLRVARRMTLKGRIKHASRTRCNAVVVNHNHHPCLRPKRTFLGRSGNLRGTRS